MSHFEFLRKFKVSHFLILLCSLLTRLPVYVNVAHNLIVLYYKNFKVKVSEVQIVFFKSSGGDASIVPMTESQPCPPVTSASSCEEADGGGILKRKAEESIEGGNVKLPRLEEKERKEEETDQFESRTRPTGTPDGDVSVPGAAAKLNQSDCEHPRVRDIHRTGAKCVPGGPADPLHPGAGYHSTGVLRVKPGRGEPTLSLSCSDKLARWGVLGFQGALLSHYLEEALYFSTLVVGKCPYNQDVMHRALVMRWGLAETAILLMGLTVKS